VTAPVVIGGLGVSGLGCALELTRRGVDFVALEKHDRPGGLARSDPVEGFRFDHGPHIVIGVPPALDELFDELPGLDLRAHSGRSGVALRDGLARVVPAPFQRHLGHLPLADRARLLLELPARVRNGPDPATYGDVARARCGTTVFKLFLGGYESKRLRFDVEDIPPDWTDRVPTASLRSVVLPRWAASRHDDTGAETRFAYPRAGGIEALPRALARLLPTEAVRCGSEIVEIDADAHEVWLSDGESVAYEELVLSLPLPEIVRLLRDPPGDIVAAARDLVYTSIHVVSLGVEGAIETPWTFMRFPGDRVPFYRVSIPSHYADDGAPPGHAVAVAEVSHHPARHRVDADTALRGARDALTELGVVGRHARVVVERVDDIRYGHVVYNHRTRAAVRTVLDHLGSCSISMCGKYGLWQDMLMAGSIVSGMDVARRIDQKTRSSSATV
jgi:protoporphyrinogen oxidase